VTLFHDMMHKEIEVSMDDMIAKSDIEKDQIQTLRILFERLKKYKLKLNPTKYTFRVKFGQLLGFVMGDKGIELEPDKVKVIQEISKPKKKIWSFLWCLNYIARFISQITTTYELIFWPLHKKNPGIWNEDFQMNFDKIKQ